MLYNDFHLRQIGGNFVEPELKKFQAIVALGIVNGRMKDYYDLWTIPAVLDLDEALLTQAIAATFAPRDNAVTVARSIKAAVAREVGAKLMIAGPGELTGSEIDTDPACRGGGDGAHVDGD